jgi:Fe-S-cluster containining protein
MAPLVHDDGTPRSKAPLPYLPVLNPCNLCPARCCRLNVKISLRDAVHYCNTLGVPFFTGLTLVPSAHSTHAFSIDRDPRINPDPEGWLGTVEIQLRRKEDGSCHALVNVGGYDRCGVYAARPSLCRLYPMSWTSDVAKGNPGMILCPVPYGVTEREEAQFLRDIETSIESWEQHDDIVIEWNERSKPEERTAEKFLEFAIPKTAEKMGVPWEGILARGTPEQRLFAAMQGARATSKPRT